MAGVLPYTRVNPFIGNQNLDDVWVMISQEAFGSDKNQWDMFGGSIDAGEKDWQAAAREGAEESIEMFGTAQQIANMMYRIGTTSTFMLNVAALKSKEQVIQDCNSMAYLQRKRLSRYQDFCYQEKTDIEWVKLASLVNACLGKEIIRDKNKQTITMRSHFKHLIVSHQKFFQDLIDRQKNYVNIPAAKAIAKKVVQQDPASVRPLPTPVAKPLVEPKAQVKPVKVAAPAFVASPIANPAKVVVPKAQIVVDNSKNLILKHGTISLEVVEEKDLCKFEAEIIVNAANEGLLAGHGVCGAIYKEGGPGIFEECKQYLQKLQRTKLNEGEVMFTSAGNLKGKKHIIHAIGPRWKNNQPDLDKQKLYSAYANALKCAHSLGVKSMAFPSLSTGIFGFPLAEATKIAAQAVKDFTTANQNSALKKISFVMWTENFQAYKNDFVKAYQ